MQLVAACASGIETPLKWELEQLGYAPTVLSPGRVGFEGTWDDVARTNYWLRTADRILIQIHTFPCSDFDELFETTKSIDWPSWLSQDAKILVTGRSKESQLTSVPAIQRASKKAIVESMLSQGHYQTLPESGPEYRIDIALSKNVANCTLDTTGPSLHKRGYRTDFGEAPIKETLAAAMILLSVWNPNRPLIDPFCGSGTIAIEAAMMAKKIAPGHFRTCAWQNWPGVATSENYRDLPDHFSTETEPLSITATDIDARVLKLARENAKRAGVEDEIHFQQKPFGEMRSKKEFGCVITNPPYGERLSDRRALLPLYKSIPGVLQRMPTWSHFIITNVPKFEGLIQKSATRRRKLYNGRIECIYYQFLGPKPHSISLGENRSDHIKPDISPEKQVSPPVFGGVTSKDREQSELFSNRLSKRARHFRKWPTKMGISCYRLYDRDIPELPFVVDRYEDYFHVTQYDRPSDRDPGRDASWCDLMMKTIAKTFDVPMQNVYLKSRQRQYGKTQHERVGRSEKTLTVEEGGLKFIVNLNDYVDTGLFLDHRKTRAMVRDESKGKRFLNLFAYTGSFTIYAADGFAKSTTTVDWSNTYLGWARKNLELNGLEGSNHQFVRQDANEFLFSLNRKEEFDLMVIDPPTFSNSKRTENVWDVQRDHVQLLSLAVRHLAKNGIIYFSTNFRRFKFEADSLPDIKTIEISKQTIPDDFRNKRIHRCWKLLKN